MKISLDFPDMPGREIVPYPMTFDGGVGFLVVVVNEREGKLAMSYVVNRNHAEEKYDGMMRDLELAAKNFTKLFNKAEAE